MKFITEDDLRAIYRKTPFTTYDPEVDTRLTPGARQFLADRGIRIYDDEGSFTPPKVLGTEGKSKSKEDVQELENLTAIKNKKLIIAIDMVEAMFLKTGSELLDLDVLVAQEVFSLKEELNIYRTGKQIAPLICHPCTGICEDNFHTWMEDCFEITGFHIQSEQGKVIAHLHYLRSIVRDLVWKLPEHDRSKVYGIINRLSQMICIAFGGKECQKQM